MSVLSVSAVKTLFALANVFDVMPNGIVRVDKEHAGVLAAASGRCQCDCVGADLDVVDASETP